MSISFALERSISTCADFGHGFRSTEVVYYQELEKLVLLWRPATRGGTSMISIYSLRSSTPEQLFSTDGGFDTIMKWQTMDVRNVKDGEIKLLATGVSGIVMLVNVETCVIEKNGRIPDTSTLIDSSCSLQIPYHSTFNDDLDKFLFLDYFFRLKIVSLSRMRNLERMNLGIHGRWGGFRDVAKRMMIISNKNKKCVYVAGELRNTINLFNYFDQKTVQFFNCHHGEIEFMTTFEKNFKEILVLGSKFTSHLYFYNEQGHLFFRLQLGPYTGYQTGIHHFFTIDNRFLIVSCEADDETYCINLNRAFGSNPHNSKTKRRIREATTYKIQTEDLDRVLGSIRLRSESSGQRYMESKVLSSCKLFGENGEEKIWMFCYFYDYRENTSSLDILSLKGVGKYGISDDFFDERLSFLKDLCFGEDNQDFIVKIGDVKLYRSFFFL